MRSRFLPLALLAFLPACTEIQTYGAAAIQQRRMMNDLQARATMAATCDISLGAYFRELSPAERRFAGLVCGGMLPGEEETPGATTTLVPGGAVL
jgi:hypothetical protein